MKNIQKYLFLLAACFTASSFFLPTSFALSTLVVQPISPAAGHVPSNALSTPLLQLRLTAQDSAINLGAIGVKRTGLSESKNIDSLRAYAGNTASMPASMQTDDTALIQFRDLINIPKGGTLTVVIKANLVDMTSGRTIGIELQKVTSTAQNVRVLPTIPFHLDETFASGSNVPNLQLEYQNTFSRNSVRVGYNSRVGQFRLTNPTTKDIYVQKLTLHNRGTANLNTTLANSTIYASPDTYIAAPATINRDTLSFFFLTSNNPNGYKIPAGSTVAFSIWADVLLTARRDHTITFELKNPEDLVYHAPSIASPQTTATSHRRRLGSRRSYTTRQRLSSANRNTPLYNRPYNTASYNDIKSRLIQIPGRTYNAAQTSRISRPQTIQRNTAYSPRLPQSSRTPAPGTKDIIFYTGTIRASGLPQTAESFRAFINPQSFASDKNGNNTNSEISDFEETFENLTLYINNEYQDQTSAIEQHNGRLFYEFDTQDVVFHGSTPILITGRVSHRAKNGDRLKLSVSKRDSFQNTDYIR